eukprot:32725-Chlamydomonas_euryale.AAC.4
MRNSRHLPDAALHASHHPGPALVRGREPAAELAHRAVRVHFHLDRGCACLVPPRDGCAAAGACAQTGRRGRAHRASLRPVCCTPLAPVTRLERGDALPPYPLAGWARCNPPAQCARLAHVHFSTPPAPTCLAWLSALQSVRCCSLPGNRDTPAPPPNPPC